jgi:UDP-galactopyranose mutase
MKKYDYLIVGSGLAGSIFAYEATKRGKSCLIIEKRNHTGGNIYTKKINNINVHMYGAHIFHTNNSEIWKYINQFTRFNSFINSPLAFYKGKYYNLPFNLNTFKQIFGNLKTDEIKKIINKEINDYRIDNPKNLEEQAVSLIGKTVYEILIKGYTEKQWGKKASELPPEIIKRIPVRFTENNNYFNDEFQGIPVDGYTTIINRMLQNSKIILNCNFNENKNELLKICDKVFYTGPLDEYFNYSQGELEYRSLNFVNEVINQEYFQKTAVINYTDFEIPFTRIIEHKHFENSQSKKTVITKEYPVKWDKTKECYYPVNDEKNNLLFNQYKEMIKKEKNIITGGRLGLYQYLDMDKVIENTLQIVNAEFDNNNPSIV